MKNFTLFFLLLANFSLFAQRTYVPDDNFEQALIELGYDSGVLDDYVPTANISGVTSLRLNSKNISDLTGIEGFTALKVLYCGYNQLTSLDVSANKALTILHCYNNQLNSLDVSANTALTQLSCSYNQLISLDLSANATLNKLWCTSNRLTSLDVSANKALIGLTCSSNQLTNLDVSANTVLGYLLCYNNQLTSLDVSANTALEHLKCPSNQLTSLDVSANTALTQLDCSSNELTSLDLRNGNNAKLTNFHATGNPDLTCIYVDDNSVSYSKWYKDATATYVNDEAECTALSTSGLKNASVEKTNTVIDELKDASEFSLFPNPVKEQFTIQTNKKVESLKLYNLTGKLVKAFDVRDTYSVSDLPAGIYYLNVSCKEETFTQKLVIE